MGREETILYCHSSVVTVSIVLKTDLMSVSCAMHHGFKSIYRCQKFWEINYCTAKKTSTVEAIQMLMDNKSSTMTEIRGFANR